MFQKIKLTDYNDTIPLETFSVMKNKSNESQEFQSIKKLHIKQLEIIKNNGVSHQDK